MNGYELTFGQVIDQLKVGGIATNIKGYAVKYDSNGTLVYFTEGESVESEQKVVILSGLSQTDKWKIQPSYVSFSIAMTELENGEIIEFHKDEHRFRFKKENQFTLLEMAQARLTFADLVDGKWLVYK
jgi:hypothetical protein